jgi:hypothetical protein
MSESQRTNSLPQPVPLVIGFEQEINNELEAVIDDFWTTHDPEIASPEHIVQEAYAILAPHVDRLRAYLTPYKDCNQPSNKTSFEERKRWFAAQFVFGTELAQSHA